MKMADVNCFGSSSDHEMKGWLYKWTNYIKGYQKRWFVLSNGNLSYYRNQAEMAHTCRGTISLVSAVIHTEDNCNFVISNGATQTFHLRAMNEVERQKWVTALELHKARAIRHQESEDDDEMDLNDDKNELQTMLKTLAMKLQDVHTCHDLIIKHGAALQRSLAELEQLDLDRSANSNSANPGAADAASNSALSKDANLLMKSKTVNERATLFRITSNAMINACAEYLHLAQTHGQKWQRLLQHEHQQRLRLEEMVEQLAKQHSKMEEDVKKELANSPISNNQMGKNNPTLQKQSNSRDSDNEDDEFYDAEDTATDFFVSFPGRAHRVSVHQLDKDSNARSLQSNQMSSIQDAEYDNSSGTDDDTGLGDESGLAGVVTRRKNRKDGSDRPDSSSMGSNSTGKADGDTESTRSSSQPGTPINDRHRSNVSMGKKSRRRRCEIPERPNHSLNLWSIMKNCIGKELTKIPMPVYFNEPLSMLQRLTEDFEYADLLHKAARCKDSLEQLVYVAVFSVSSYSTTANRLGKPFNPLLGETYECDRTDDLGWRCFSEQVGHHPPALATYCEGRGWVCWREFAMSSKFRGKYLQVNPVDITHVRFANSSNEYTWKKVTTTVHNIIVGKLWVDHHGDMVITNHNTGETCHLKFIPYSYFSRDVPRKVTGVVLDKDGEAKWVLQGTWDSKMEAAKVIKVENSRGKPILETATPKVFWKRVLPPPDYDKMYNMTVLAVQLNEPEEGVAPTDSRLRPDQRLMEVGKWDEANIVKGLLEEKQRAVRRAREEEAERAAIEGRPYQGYEPVWFKIQKDPITGNPVHMFQGDYWKCKEKQEWSKCPDIYLPHEQIETVVSSTP